MWLVMSNGARQPDGSYSGALYRLTGPAFNALPWGNVSLTQVGTMRIAFNNFSAATLSYSVNGVSVSKVIVRQRFSTAPTCAWSAFDRTLAQNYQDLWWNPREPGWGINIAHQGDILFATLFTYDASGRAMWLVMSNGTKTPDGGYSGTLYRTSGPVFNASPWTSVQLNPVGTMHLAFSDGAHGTLSYTVNGAQVSKPIERQVFASVKTQCDPAQ